MDEKTREVGAVEITVSHIGDAPILPDLIDHVTRGQGIDSITAGSAYDTRKCYDVIADRGFRAIIAPHKKAKPCKTITAGAVAQNEALRASTNPGRDLWSRWRGYHRRSHVETEMYRVKSLGQRLLVRDSTARSQSSRFALPP